MADELPDTGRFAYEFVRFVQAMHEAAVGPEGPWVQMLREHLDTEPAGLPVTTTTVRVADRPNLQLALDAVLPDRDQVGLSPRFYHGGEGFAELVGGQGAHEPARSAPVQYVNVEVGDGRVMQCVSGALLLAHFDGRPVALLLGESGRRMGPHTMSNEMEVRLEGISPDDEVVSRLFTALRAAMLEHNVFRGRVISFTGFGAVVFHQVPDVTRDAIVLPDGVLERLEQHALGISRHADELRKAGRHLKRGILLHGPPGTGKTLTINYLPTATAGRTTVVLTGSALGFIESAFGIARELAPATVVLEDVDLVATERFTRGSGGVLFELLNELEGLSEDTDLLVVLTTNRPDVIEPALAARPGRVDLALEAPLPDADGRRRLLLLYAREIVLPETALAELVEHTDGVTGAFIKELMRQATLRAALAGRPPNAEDVRAIAEELLDERATLTQRLLGHGGTAQAELGEPLPTMARAVTAAGLGVGMIRHSELSGPR
jgi:DNA polymerase III delta prime subunit